MGPFVLIAKQPISYVSSIKHFELGLGQRTRHLLQGRCLPHWLCERRLGLVESRITLPLPGARMLLVVLSSAYACSIMVGEKEAWPSSALLAPNMHTMSNRSSQ
jgi:hypothetical protein